MKLSGYLLAIAAATPLTAILLAQQAAPPQPLQVMIIGSFHMNNPGHDIHNVSVNDVLQPRPQSEIKAAVASLATFHPTKVMAESPQDVVDERFPKYVAGTLPPSRNEVVQLGFRLARQSGLQKVYGIDADGDFPYQAMQTFAHAHGEDALLDRENSNGEKLTQTVNNLLKTQGIVATLRYMNDPARLKNDNRFFREMLFRGCWNTAAGRGSPVRLVQTQLPDLCQYPPKQQARRSHRRLLRFGARFSPKTMRYRNSRLYPRGA